MRIVIDQAIPYLDGVFDPWADVVRESGSRITREQVRDADALIVRTRTRCDESLLEGSRVSFIATATIGFDHIDTGWCRRRGIGVATSAGCNSRGVLQWIAAALVYLSQVQGWQPAERTLGVVGVGNIGSLVRDYARSWGFRVLCCDPPRQRAGEEGLVEMDRIAAEADIVTLHVPSDATTRHLVDGNFVAALDRHATIINTSRGEVVDGRALLAAGLPCALDVWEGEPAVDRTLLSRALIATPHIAGYSAQGKAAASAMAVSAVARRFGLPLEGWYPHGVEPSCPRPIGWDELRRTIGSRFDIAGLTQRLKSSPADFELIRDGYDYRTEYF